jgi:hypothetical protein
VSERAREKFDGARIDDVESVCVSLACSSEGTAEKSFRSVHKFWLAVTNTFNLIHNVAGFWGCFCFGNKSRV